jgi:hypothetical protein
MVRGSAFFRWLFGPAAPHMPDNARTFPISDRLLDHRRKMGSSVWEYLWLRTHVTTTEPAGSVGIVDGGRPVPTGRIAADLRRSREATLANLEKLEAGNYIERSAAVGHAYSYRVSVRLEGPAG